MPFSGADVGGFFGNPSKELLTRWYQAGIWYPFFRAHAHIDARRREPWVPGEPYTSVIRDAVNIRYQLLPLFYTKFYQSSLSGAPVLDPLFYRYPDNEETYEIEDEFFLGDLLIKPVTDESAVSQSIYLPDEEIYYDYEDFSRIQGKGNHQVDAPLDKIPIFIKGGAVIPRKDRYRRSSKLTKYDPYTLVVALSLDGTAKGQLYIDDGETFDYKNGEFLYTDFELKNGILSSAPSSGNLKTDLKVEKIIVIGGDIGNATASQDGKSWSVSVEKHEHYSLVKNPGVFIEKEWSITF
jgi:alpha 1,3-glucosidase